MSATVSYLPSAGSGAVLDAVDETLTELFGSGQHLSDAQRVRAMWINGARWRLLDAQHSAPVRHCDAVSVDEHAQALTVSVSGDVAELGVVDRETWRMRELLSCLRGDQRRWADAWCDAVLDGHAQPRGLDQVLGWSARKTERVSAGARREMTTFALARQSGAVCDAQRELLEAFTAMTASSQRHTTSERLGQQAYERVVFHVAGCEDCWAAWHAGRRSLLTHPALIWTVPAGKLIGAIHALHARLTGVLTRRVGMGSRGS